MKYENIDASKFSKRQQKRLASIYPNNIPTKVRIYDNQGRSLDRYTIVFTGRYLGTDQRQYAYLGSSEHPFAPNGFGNMDVLDKIIDYPTYGHLGKKVSFDSLPVDVQAFVRQEYLYLWQFTDVDGKYIFK